MHKHAEAFSKIFQANPEAFGRVVLTDEICPKKNKRITKNWLVKNKKFDLETWSDHLLGTKLIGALPLLPDLTCMWGAIDVDIYNDKNSIQDVLDKIRKHQLPFIPFRSKSGGLHLYIFFQSPIKAAYVIPILESFAGYFGRSEQREIFPSHAYIGKEDDDAKFGFWLNMPYGGSLSLQYALDENDERIDLDKFIETIESKRISEAQLRELKTPSETNAFWEEGPPCLNTIFTEKVYEMEMRNVCLSNASVLLKKINFETWKQELNKLNLGLPDPIPDGELRAIQDSYSKKDYKYQCKKSPLVNYCDYRLCQTKKYGIASSEIFAKLKSITKLDTDPPIWYLDVGDKRVSLSTEQLYSFSQFAKRHMEVLNSIPDKTKQGDWEAQINNLMEHVRVLDVDPSMTPQGILKDVIEEWLVNSGNKEGFKNLLACRPYEDNFNVYFRMRDLMEYISGQRLVSSMKQNQITQIIKEHLHGEKAFKVINGKGINFWKVPNNFERITEIETEEVEKDPF